MYKENLALNNLKWLMCHKAKPKRSNLYSCSFPLFLSLNLNWVYIYIEVYLKDQFLFSSGQVASLLN